MTDGPIRNGGWQVLFLLLAFYVLGEIRTEAQPLELSSFAVNGSGAIQTNGAYLLGGTAGAPDATTTATNDMGMVLNSGFWSVVLADPVPPLFTKQPLSLVVTQGLPASFDVSVIGTLPLSYQWRFNGMNLLGEIMDSFTIADAQPAVAGSYAVQVSNLAGIITSDVAVLTVLEVPPTITAQPVSETVGIGSAAAFSVTAEGGLPLLYQWRHNGHVLAGENNATLNIDLVQVSDGGTYEAVVINETGAVLSEAVQLVVDVTILPAGDNFSSRVLLSGASGLIRGSTAGATRELGEPNHARKQGSASGWYTWSAPVAGIMTLKTEGSTFDTLLAAYQGTSLASLMEVAGDDDHAGFHTSEIRFNATMGMTYQIAVDGLGTESGVYLLSWSLESTAETIPVILTNPVSQVAQLSSAVTFDVATEPGDLLYQWLFNGTPIPGATVSSRVLAKVEVADVGFYSVRVTNPLGRVVESLPAALEIGSFPNMLSVDKIAELPIPGGIGTGGGRAVAWAGGLIPASAGLVEGGIVSVGVGTTIQHHSPHAGSLDIGEPVHCDVGKAASRWYQIRLTNDSLCVVSVSGTNFDPVVSVYLHSPAADYYDYELACSHGRSSRFCFYAPSGFSCRLVVVERTNAVPTREATRFNLTMEFFDPNRAMLRNSTAPISALKLVGDCVVFAVPSEFGPVLDSPATRRYQWFKGADLLRRADNLILTLPSLQFDDAGDYSLVISNGASVETKGVGLMAIGEIRLNRGTGHPELWGMTSAEMALETRSVFSLSTPWTLEKMVFPSATAERWHVGMGPSNFYRVRSALVP